MSTVPKRPAHKGRHLCADRAYDAEDLREVAASVGYITHIKNKRAKRGAERPPAGDSWSKKVHLAIGRVVGRTISWLVKRRGLRTRWSAKAGNWPALVQSACAHILLTLVVFG